MEGFLSRLANHSQLNLARRHPPLPWVCRSCSRAQRVLSTTTTRQARKVPEDPKSTPTPDDSSHAQPAADLSHNVSQAEKDHFKRIERESKDKQTRSPWMRQGSDVPPVERDRVASAMVKGKLLTTPSRMLKLILPLSTRDAGEDSKKVEPLALLVHPQQPLSYLERLIQSELPALEKDGQHRVPAITFRAQDRTEEDNGSGKTAAGKAKEHEEGEEEDEEYDIENAEETMVNGKLQRTGKISPAGRQRDGQRPIDSRGKEEKETLDAYAPPDPDHPNFVRWSPSTEIGDFIRDAARGKEFAIDIEGSPDSVYVGVPSFQDRTYYLRMRLRKTARRISALADIKRECDELAHRGAKRVAQLGFTALIAWWGAVYYLTFRTSLGWDVMEPITYLVGLTSLIGGYTWFLYHNREVSYRSAMNFTISRRQSQLYEAKGLDLGVWEGLVEEGNRLRREIRMVADEYDVEWDESKDEGDEKVREALREARKKEARKNGQKDDKDDEDED